MIIYVWLLVYMLLYNKILLLILDWIDQAFGPVAFLTQYGDLVYLFLFLILIPAARMSANKTDAFIKKHKKEK